MYGMQLTFCHSPHPHNTGATHNAHASLVFYPSHSVTPSHYHPFPSHHPSLYPPAHHPHLHYHPNTPSHHHPLHHHPHTITPSTPPHHHPLTHHPLTPSLLTHHSLTPHPCTITPSHHHHTSHVHHPHFLIGIKILLLKCPKSHKKYHGELLPNKFGCPCLP